MQMGFVLTLSQFHGILDSLEIAGGYIIHYCYSFALFLFPQINFMKLLFSKLSPRMNMNHYYILHVDNHLYFFENAIKGTLQISFHRPHFNSTVFASPGDKGV